MNNLSMLCNLICKFSNSTFSKTKSPTHFVVLDFCLALNHKISLILFVP